MSHPALQLLRSNYRASLPKFGSQEMSQPALQLLR
jgi:hypothetical protein